MTIDVTTARTNLREARQRRRCESVASRTNLPGGSGPTAALIVFASIATVAIFRWPSGSKVMDCCFVLAWWIAFSVAFCRAWWERGVKAGIDHAAKLQAEEAAR